MKTQIFLISLFLSITLSTSILGQNVKSLSPQQLNRDFDIAIEAIHSTHPSLNRYISEDSLQSFIQESRKLLENEMSEEEFHLVFRKIIRKIGCGHLFVRPSAEWYSGLKSPTLVPFDILLKDNRMYIREAYHGDSLLIPGLEILSIDGKSSADILAEMNSIQERDGYIESFALTKVERLFRTYYLFLYGMNESYNIQYLTLDGEPRRIDVKGGGASKAKKKENGKPNYKIELESEKKHFYILKDQPGIAFLDINSFPRKGYKKFYKSVFKEIEKNEADNLIIDLRDNGGGYFPNGNRFLRYLLEEEFLMTFSRPNQKVEKAPGLKMNFWGKMTRFLFNLMPDKDKEDPRRNYAIKVKPIKKYGFRGNVYVLINGGSFSLSSYTSSMLRKHSNTVFVGEECGGGMEGSNALLEYSLTLPESSIRIRLPYLFLNHRLDNAPKGRGIMPDHLITYSINDRLQGKDLEMEKVLSLINENSN